MKVKDKAIADLTKILAMVEEMRLPMIQRNNHIAVKMRQYGWDSVTTMNLPETARDLGFLVIGDSIYAPDD
jgi:hypothetical protein